MDKQYIVQASYSYQVTEDHWELSTMQKRLFPGDTVKEIVEWAKENKLDENTIKILPLS
jgi:hypothetical protein